MDYDGITTYRKNLEIEVFTCMELSNQSYIEVMSMPVNRLSNYLKWKSDLEENKRKLIQEKNQIANSKRKK